jgi:hypothetical protein
VVTGIMMSEKIAVHAQGIRPDLAEANGHYDLRFLGLMDQEELMALFNRIQGFTIPRGPGENTCPPGLLTSGPGGPFSFAMGEEGLFNFETSAYITPREAIALAFGNRNPDLEAAQIEKEPAGEI